MATELVNLDNSFIRFNEDAARTCIVGPEYIFPFHDFTDFVFMVKFTDATEAYVDNLGLRIVASSGSVTGLFSNIPLYNVEVATGTFVVYNKFSDLDSMDDTLIAENLNSATSCFYMQIFKLDDDAAPSGIVATSNQFYYEPETCFTQVVQYSCNENSFGFYYNEVRAVVSDWANIVRIRLTKHSPQLPSKKNVFQLSDGTYKKLSSSMQEEYSCLVDHANKNFHKRLAAALEHDFVSIGDAATINPNVVADSDDYKIEWEDKPGDWSGVARSTFKIKSQPFFNQNSNC